MTRTAHSSGSVASGGAPSTSAQGWRERIGLLRRTLVSRVLRIETRHLPLLVTALLLLVLYGSGWILYEPFRSLRFLVDLVKGNAAMGLCAVGMTFVIISGGIDLSVGSILALTTVTGASLIGAGVAPPIAMIVALGFATIFGMLNGVFVYQFALPPFLVTLAGMFFARGLAFAISPAPTSIEHPTLDFIMDELGFNVVIPGMGRAWVPPTAVLFLLVVLVAIVVARNTRFGRNVYAIGGDSQAAGLMGLPLGTTTVGLYGLSGLCAGLAGVATILIDSAGKPNVGAGIELEAIAAVVIGGTVLTGGIGTVAGTLMGVMIIGIVRAVINLDGRLPSPWHHITIGLLLLAFITMQQLLSRRAKAQRA